MTSAPRTPRRRAGVPHATSAVSSSTATASPSSPREDIFASARDGVGAREDSSLDDLLAATSGGPPRFFSPLGPDPTREDRARPLMLYVPGLDGTGFAAASQFESLSRDFDLVALNVPVDDRSSFDQLVDRVVDFLERERDAREAARETARETARDAARVRAADRPRRRARASTKNAVDPAVYLLGESMGGLVSLGVARARPDLVDRLILVNPASSFDASPWPAIGPLLPNLPEDLYAALPYALAPALFDPSDLAEGALAAARSAAAAASNAPAGSVPSAAARAATTALGERLPALDRLAAIIPRDTLAHRLGVLAEGCAVVNAPGALESIAARTLVVASSADALIPSRDEGVRLRGRLPSCVVEVLEGASHAALQEEGMDLSATIRRNGFAPRRDEDPPPLCRDPAFAPPSPRDLERAFASLDPLRAIVSPVFFSTRADGSVVEGLDAVPLSEKDRPVLLVGNHQTLAPDLGFLVEGFVRQRGTLVRGLAHPVVAGAGAEAGTGTGARRGDENGARGSNAAAAAYDSRANRSLPFGLELPAPPDLRDAVERAWRTNAHGNGGIGAAFGGGVGPDPGPAPGGLGAFTTFGAVPVSGRNFYRLLAAGECVLLFPGGVREAFKRKGESYRLFWPSKPEFVRMAIRHGATIVPFAAVGAEDALEIVADSDDVAKLPFGLGDAAMERSRAVPRARAVDTRVTEDGEAEETFVQPIVVPKTPKRYYFKFGAPISTAGLRDAGVDKDEEKVRALYARVRGDVEDGVDWLLRKRGEDPFEDTLKRAVWEAASGKRAPTFKP